MAHEAVQTQQLHGFSQADYDRTRLEIRRLLTNQHSANASPSSSSSSPVAPALSASSSSSPSTSTSKAPAPTAPTSAPGPVPLPAAQQQKHQQDPFGRDIRLQIPPPPTPFHQQTQTESQSSPARAKGSLDRFLSGDKVKSRFPGPPGACFLVYILMFWLCFFFCVDSLRCLRYLHLPDILFISNTMMCHLTKAQRRHRKQEVRRRIT